MESIDDVFAESLNKKRNGGVRLDIFISNGVWLGGLHESRAHQPFVAVGPANWDCEDELTFFKDQSEVNDFIEKLLNVSREAFGEST